MGELEKAGAYSEALLKSMSDGIGVLDLEGKVIDVNEPLLQMMGLRREEILGLPLLQLLDSVAEPAEVEKASANIGQLLAGAPAGFIEMVITHKDGTRVTISIGPSVVRDAQGKPVKLFAVMRDITERKRMEQEIQGKNEQLNAQNEELQATEEELRASNEELRAANEELQATLDELTRAKAYNEGLIESMIDGFGVLDLEGKVVDVNGPLLQMTGLRREAILGLPMKQVLDSVAEPAEAEKVSAAIGQLMAGAPAGFVEMVITHKDGTRVTISIGPSVVRDAQGKPVKLFAVMRDITERKRMEQEIQGKNEQLNAQNEELQATEEELRASNEELTTANEELKETQDRLIRSERLAAIGQLAGGVGHELRNPLGAIKNAVYYIKGKLAKSEMAGKEPRILEFLDIMDDEIDGSNRIINDLLGFSRVGKPAVAPTPVRKIIADAMARVPVPENVELNENFGPDSVEIAVDSEQIQQVLVNVINNAVQAMPEGGKLTISTREKNGYLELDVIDTGSGIADEAIGKIFEPLFTTKAKGIGLGLAVSKSIIDRHGGRIEAESVAGRGTTFTIRLPLETPVQEASIEKQ